MTWQAFLPIGGALKAPDPPDADVAWLASRGIEGEALSVLRVLRRDVLPLARELGCTFSFLIHDRTSGVPCLPEDHSAYVHLRLEGERALPERWIYRGSVDEPFDGVLARQSAWYLDLIESGAELSDIDLLQNIRKHLHFFANMSQMRIS